MKLRFTMLIVVVGLLAAAWVAAYWYVGADARFLRGLIKSEFKKPMSVQVVANSSVDPVNTNVGQWQFVGFTQKTAVSGFTEPTRMAIEPGTNDLVVSELGGNIWRARTDGTKQLVASGFSQLLGASFDDPIQYVPIEQRPLVDIRASLGMLVASRGTISMLEHQGDGTYGNRRDVVTNLPAGRHQTDLALIGPDDRLYIATGSRSDRGSGGIDPHEASVLVSEADGSDLRVFAKGLRNPYGMTFFKNRLYVTDNGQDVPASGVPDELNIVDDGKDYGWVGCWGVGQGSDCAGTEPPVALLPEHSSANGFAVYDAEQFPEEYRGNFFIALWGANSKDPDIGKKVVRVIPQDSGLWRVEDFVTGLGNPIDVKVDPADGSLLILDFDKGEVIRATAQYAEG